MRKAMMAAVLVLAAGSAMATTYTVDPDHSSVEFKVRHLVGKVRGRGFLLGVELVDPRDGSSFLPDELDAAALVEQAALDNGLLIVATHSTADGYAGDQVLVAPAFTATDSELAEMVERLAAAIGAVERRVGEALA